ncbi:Lipase 2 [Streptomyces sp. RB5]|uniref:Lipase 2 n=1 Tax=Streptomyces smaragdinus TaxID=2585196 RepID=A0A7K0CSZ8_9ACTN|nr:SGNH/GDSL hydrolase family protein [Streptomyces smaragdinus]MQY16142.1 Lipase 2 [Streptomyces smaragdinus]
MKLRARSRTRRLAAIAVAAGTAALSLTVPAAAEAAAPLDYVALGDSYSAGSGVLPLDPDASLLCLRTTRNYPHVLAQKTGADLTDVTCGGAETKHFTQSQYPGVPAQLDAVNAGTDLVTLTIGGNDNGTFINAILACGTAGVGTLGFGSPCKDQYGSRFTDEITTNTLPRLRESLRAIKAKAPNARVAILGYPWIMPASYDWTCFVKMPIARGDVPYLRSLQAHLNSAVQQAAGETGATYVDMSAASEGHDACASSGTRWIEPVLFGTNLVPVHPNASGEAAMAQRTASVLGL